MFTYDLWANREEIAHLRAMVSPPPRALAILAHIIATEWLWLSRIRGEASPLAVWPTLTLDECESYLEKITWRDVDAEKLVTYVNSRGEIFTNSAGDIAAHAMMHGAYHRGQIALIVRDAGETPAYTDYIHYVRSVALHINRSAGDSSN
jgi:uncharacterized damage-inducible protein DinB